MDISMSQNKYIDFFMILAWLCCFKIIISLYSIKY